MNRCLQFVISINSISFRLRAALNSLRLNDDTLELVKCALIKSHEDELAFHNKRIGILNGQKKKLEHRLHQIYVDKIDGKVSDDFYDDMMDKWQEELSKIKESIRRHENGDASYFAQGIHILELCNKAHRLYLRQTPVKRVKLLHYLLSNCTLSDGSLCPTYRNPFDLIAKGVSRSNWLPECAGN